MGAGGVAAGEGLGIPRSGLSFRQCIPASVVAIRYWNPARSSCGLVAVKIRGWSPLERRASELSMLGLMLIHWPLGLVIFMIPAVMLSA